MWRDPKCLEQFIDLILQNQFDKTKYAAYTYA
jgi:hypothetical protein